MVRLNDIVENIVKFSVLDKTGQTIHAFSAKNTLTYAAGGVFINALLGSGPAQVTFLYARYGNNQGSPPSGSLILPPGGIKAVTIAQFTQSNSPDQGGLWVPLLGAPLVGTSNSSIYSNNVATYSFRIPANIASLQQSPIGTFAAASAYITTVGLAVAGNVANRAQDIIIAVLDDFTPLQVPAGGQLGIDYPLQIAP